MSDLLKLGPIKACDYYTVVEYSPAFLDDQAKRHAELIMKQVEIGDRAESRARVRPATSSLVAALVALVFLARPPHR